MRKKWTALVLVMAMIFSLSGCLFRSPDDLYRQPEKSAGYEKLNSAIRKAKAGLEAEYGTSVEDAGITAGDNTANIQLQDLDGDDVRESALTFIRVPGVEKPLKIYVFTQVGEEYVVTGVAEGEGNAIYSIEYAQINETGRKELVVIWQISTGAYQLGVYTLDDLNLPDSDMEDEDRRAALMQLSRSELMGTELLLTRCSVANDGSSGVRLLDMNRDTRTEVGVIRLDPSGLNSSVELYGWREGGLSTLAVAELSAGMISLNRIRNNSLAGEYVTPALYITGTLADGRRAIDVIGWMGDRLTNLALDNTGVSREIIQGYAEVTPTDINGDYVVELPSPTVLPTYGESSSTNFWLIDWGQYDARGNRNHVLTTYHNVSDGWYLEIPESWSGQITISRNDQVSGRREVIFSRWRGENQEPKPFLSIYRLSGSQNAQLEDGWFILQDDNSVAYAAQFHDNGWDCGLDDMELRDRFKIIRTSWYYE